MQTNLEHLLPVTILTGFLGSGKTTLLNRVLNEVHGGRIAVIENEFGEAGIDNELLVHEGREQIVEMNNGCICCTVRGDLVRILGELAQRRDDGSLHFDRVIIETTGLADPAPVAQTFFVDEAVAARYRLDAIVTVVDAKHAAAQIEEHHEALEQVGFADRILLSKTDLVSSEEADALAARLRHINPQAPIRRTHFGDAPIDFLLDLGAFSLDHALEIDPAFLGDEPHEHDDDITSFVYRSNRPFELALLEDFLNEMIARHGPDMLRYKAILNLAGHECRGVFQGVHMLLAGTFSRPWAKDELRSSTLVFIGRRLPEAEFRAGLEACHTTPD